MKAIVGLTLLLIGCQPILGIEPRELDPIKVGVCELGSGGDAQVRFAELTPDGSLAVDLCLTPSGAAPGRGILRGGGTTCPTGFRYPQVSRVFSIPAGVYDAKIIHYGDDCAQPGLGELRGVAVPATRTTTFVQSGVVGSTMLAAHGAQTKLDSGKTLVRLIHAIPNGPPLDMGLASDDRPPTRILQKLFAEPISYGASSAGNSALAFDVTADGYAAIPTTGVNLGVARAGEESAIVATGFPNMDSVRTLYAVGDFAQPLLPVRGLFCDDLAIDATPLATCRLTSLSTLSVDMISAGLFGGVAKDEDERRPTVLTKISQRDSDFACVTQISRRADKHTLLELAKARFPYSVSLDTDLDTLPSDPRDVGAAAKNPPCGGSADPVKTKALFDCLSLECTSGGTDDGRLKSSGDWSKADADCLGESCAAEFIGLFTGDTPAQKHDHARCYDCVIANFLSDKTLGATRAVCNGDPRDPYAFDGETPSLLLSRFKITRQDTLILPSTMFRRVVHFARLEVEPGREVDVYCGHANSNYIDLVPYGGRYFTKEAASDAWLEERALEVERMVAWIDEKSAGRPLVLAGEWDSSNKIVNAKGEVVIESRDPDIADALDAAFDRTIPAGHDPECTMCPDNPMGNAVVPLLPTRIYTRRFPIAAATDFSTFFKESIVPMPSGPLVPLSGVYGLNVRVKRP